MTPPTARRSAASSAANLSSAVASGNRPSASAAGAASPTADASVHIAWAFRRGGAGPVRVDLRSGAQLQRPARSARSPPARARGAVVPMRSSWPGPRLRVTWL
ncbi:hypothetical protein ACLQ2S_23650 [Micromonospora sp. DT48]|uniref:hypothetical protein n=1 Tax=Micromonospora sp. CP22 TaxID=2580517 RepID=UPI0012BCB6B9|nr:hypothetical protein [Micromonospora sp. CP22]